MDILKTIPKWIKQVFNDPKLLLTLFISSLFLLFAPPDWLARLGFDLLVAEYRGVISVVCLFSGTSLSVTILTPILDSLAGRQLEKGSQNEGIKYLKNLTDDEKAILLEFIGNQTKGARLEPLDASVNRLEQEGIIYQSVTAGTRKMSEWASYIMKDWAYDYLVEHPDLLELPDPPERYRSRQIDP